MHALAFVALSVLMPQGPQPTPEAVSATAKVDPRAVARRLEPLVRRRPTNRHPRLQGLYLASLYRAREVATFEQAYDQALAQGVRPGAMLKASAAFRQMMAEVGAALRRGQEGVLPTPLATRLVLDLAGIPGPVPAPAKADPVPGTLEVPAPAPVPHPSPAEGGPTSLDAALKALDRDPRAAVLALRPMAEQGAGRRDPRVQGTYLAALYRARSVAEFERAYDEALRSGVGPTGMIQRSAAFREVLREVGQTLRAGREGVLPKALGNRLAQDVATGR